MTNYWHQDLCDRYEKGVLTEHQRTIQKMLQYKRKSQHIKSPQSPTEVGFTIFIFSLAIFFGEFQKDLFFCQKLSNNFKTVCKLLCHLQLEIWYTWNIYYVIRPPILSFYYISSTYFEPGSDLVPSSSLGGRRRTAWGTNLKPGNRDLKSWKPYQLLPALHQNGDAADPHQHGGTLRRPWKNGRRGEESALRGKIEDSFQCSFCKTFVWLYFP